MGEDQKCTFGPSTKYLFLSIFLRNQVIHFSCIAKKVKVHNGFKCNSLDLYGFEQTAVSLVSS